MYVVDTMVFSNLFKHIKFGSFKAFWISFEELFNRGEIISSREVYRELESFFLSSGYNNNDEVSRWLKNHKSFFLTPDDIICKKVSEIFMFKQFRLSVKKQSLLNGNPEADVFVVATAIVKKAIVVTNEKFKPNGSKIPNICKTFNVDCINGDEFNQLINDFFESELKDAYYK
jgi:hypothetical protein